MSSFDEIRDLREKTQRNRRELIRTDLQTCSIALEKAHFELSLGNTEEAGKEYAMICRGIQTIERFLRQATGDVTEMESRLAEVRASTESLRRELGTFPGVERLSTPESGNL